MGVLSTACLLVGFVVAHASSPGPITCGDHNPTVRNQADLDKLAACNTIEGSIVIGHDFRGRFHLPGLALIGNTLFGERDPTPGSGSDSLAAVTEISLPDLQFVIEGMDLVGLTRLARLDMPRLRSVGSGSLARGPSPELTRFSALGGPLLDLAFPELESVGMVWFEGNIGSIDMPKLNTARFMHVNSTADFDCNALQAQLRHVDFTDGGLECYSSANINNHGDDEGQGGEDSDEAVGGAGSFLHGFGEMLTQMVLAMRRFAI